MSDKSKKKNDDNKKPDKYVLDIIIETPKGSRNKYKYDEKRGGYRLSGVLTSGSTFPYDFGYIPQTLGEDGDPLDILVLMDEPAFPGCLISARLIGVIEAEQTEEGETKRNDRLIAVAEESRTHSHVHALNQIAPRLLSEIEHFFISYTQMRDEEFKPLRRASAAAALRLIKQGHELFLQE